MKVIFKKTNEIKQVSFGYAVNYLFPQGLAVPATPQEIKKVKDKKLKEEKQKKQQDDQNQELAKAFSGKQFEIQGKVGKKGKLFGAITKKELAKRLGVDKSIIILSEPIKKIGQYPVELKFGEKRVIVEVIIKKGEEK